MDIKSVSDVALGNENEGLVHISNAMSDFRCIKKVKAAKILNIDYQADSGDVEVTLSHPDIPEITLPYVINHELITRYKPSNGDYLVMYEDGYLSISPKFAFENGYVTMQTDWEYTKVPKEHIDQMVSSLRFEFSRVGTTTVTGCWAFLPNGFKAGYGESSCVDPDNFNEDDGKKYAKENCILNSINKLWELEGYLLKVTGTLSLS